MQATENENKNDDLQLRERAQRRAIENVALSDRSAGARVTAVVRERIADGSERIVITNADCGVPRELVDHAFDALRYSGFVCVPAGDGEIALLAMTQSHDALLTTVPWGTSAALEELLRLAREQHISVMLLPPT